MMRAPGAQGQFDVVTHAVGTDRIGQPALGLIEGDAAVGLGDRHGLGGHLGDSVGGGHGIARPDSTVGPDRRHAPDAGVHHSPKARGWMPIMVWPAVSKLRVAV